jgi:hypothetical protein
VRTECDNRRYAACGTSCDAFCDAFCDAIYDAIYDATSDNVPLTPQHVCSQARHPAMNEFTISTEALARFHAAASEYTGIAKAHAGRLEAVRDDIAAMRAKGASYRTISDMLSRCGIRTTDTSVRRFCQLALGEQPGRATRSKSRSTPHKHASTAPKAAPLATPSTSVNEAAQVAMLDDLLNGPPLDTTTSPQPGGPRIAKIKFANPNEL